MLHRSSTRSALVVIGLALSTACGGRVSYGGGGQAGSSTGGFATGGSSSGGTGIGGMTRIDAGAGGAGVAGATGDSRPFYREYADRIEPPFVAGGGPPPAVGGTPVSVTVDDVTVLRSLPRTLYGNNSAVWDGDTLLSATMLDRLQAVNVSMLRFPGGSTSDTYHWDGVYPAYARSQGWNAMSQPWAVSTDEYMGVVKKLGAIPLVTANYGYATYDTTVSDGKVANAARLAADWVEYCNSPNDGSNPNGGTDWAARRAAAGSSEPYHVRYWEIGNESYGSWESGYEPNGDTYAANFNVIADAMKAVDPHIFIGLVTQVDSPMQDWTLAALRHPGTLDRADFLIVHNYFRWISSSADLTADSALAALSDPSQLRDHKNWLDDLVRSANRDPEALPYYLGEYNINLPTNPLQISLVSGLFMSKVLGELATNGWAAASLWDVVNGYDDTSSGLGGGDHGFLATGQPSVPDLTPRPSYYAFYFFTRNFGDHLVQSNSNDPMVAVYSSTWTGGGAGVVLVNSAPTSRSVKVLFRNLHLTGPANAWILTGSSLTSKLVTLNGIGPSNAVAGGPVVGNVVPYRLVPDDSQSFTLDLPGSSVGSVVVY